MVMCSQCHKRMAVIFVTKVENGEKAYIFNSTGDNGAFIEVGSKREYELYDIFGECYKTGTLHAGINRVELRNCEMILIR